ncbi:zinc-binding alcohol dehydrogenase family protein [Pseudomonas aeruginosa]|nr:zinc-binding alcohol dehydrogenase family protein [Pseudomonas aeruginosa]
MRAVGLYRALPIDEPGALVDLIIPAPEPNPLDLLVRVEAVSVNPADCRVRLRKKNDGHYAILGWDVAGTVLDKGTGVGSQFEVGDKVYYAGTIERPGANSELHVVDHRIVAHRPRNLSSNASAAVPLVALTAWEALFDRMGFSMDCVGAARSLLIIGAAGGVGSMAVQFGRLIPGLCVIATASKPESQQWCSSLGAHHVIDHTTDLQEQLSALGRSSVNAVLLLSNPDMYFARLHELISPQGVICSIVPFTRPHDFNPLMRKSVTFHWEYMFTRSSFQTEDLSKQSRILYQVADLIEEGRIITPLFRELQPIQAETLIEAHRLLECGHSIGKIAVFGFPDT